jgi:pimeloyl-ACP methyl ester carboxylesterase
MNLNYTRVGQGEPLLLLHGTGSHWPVWLPVLDLLAQDYDVIAVDLPGHGESPVLGAGDPPPTAAGFARVLRTFLDELGVDTPHVVGNSMGGWTALEMAKLGQARSVTALCPAGLWRNRTPRYCYASLWASYYLATLVNPVVRPLTATTVGRTLMLGQVTARPWHISAGAAAAMVANIAHSPGFKAHLRATASERFRGGQAIDVPVTVAWGEKDRLLIPAQTHFRAELPVHTGWVTLRGCGHVPMSDDPEQVAQVIRMGSRVRQLSAS